MMEHSQTDDYDILVFDALVSVCLGLCSASVCDSMSLSTHAARFLDRQSVYNNIEPDILSAGLRFPE